MLRLGFDKIKPQLVLALEIDFFEFLFSKARGYIIKCALYSQEFLLFFLVILAVIMTYYACTYYFATTSILSSISRRKSFLSHHRNVERWEMAPRNIVNEGETVVKGMKMRNGDCTTKEARKSCKQFAKVQIYSTQKPLLCFDDCQPFSFSRRIFKTLSLIRCILAHICRTVEQFHFISTAVFFFLVSVVAVCMVAYMLHRSG